MRALLLIPTSAGALAQSSTAPHNHATATGAACAVCGRAGCTSCAAGKAAGPPCGKGGGASCAVKI